jgi:hypothetical protein
MLQRWPSCCLEEAMCFLLHHITTLNTAAPLPLHAPPWLLPSSSVGGVVTAFRLSHFQLIHKDLPRCFELSMFMSTICGIALTHQWLSILTVWCQVRRWGYVTSTAQNVPCPLFKRETSYTSSNFEIFPQTCSSRLLLHLSVRKVHNTVSVWARQTG